jgi:hypothetical protein
MPERPAVTPEAQIIVLFGEDEMVGQPERIWALVVSVTIRPELLK